MPRAPKKKKLSSKFLTLDNYQTYIKTPSIVSIVSNAIHRCSSHIFHVGNSEETKTN